MKQNVENKFQKRTKSEIGYIRNMIQVIFREIAQILPKRQNWLTRIVIVGLKMLLRPAE